MRLLDRFGGVSTYFEHDPYTGVSTLHTVEDVEPHIEAAKALQNQPEHWKDGVAKSWVHYASIPHTVIMRWKKEKGLDIFNRDHMPAILKLLNDPENLFLKTTTKKHSC